ncbi:hypothetical protein J6590_031491 [Homalodisca vitripennis]|nr:hypothetical protein J6590_031491 [Homalodisca vitripennis]
MPCSQVVLLSLVSVALCQTNFQTSQRFSSPTQTQHYQQDQQYQQGQQQFQSDVPRFSAPAIRKPVVTGQQPQLRQPTRTQPALRQPQRQQFEQQYQPQPVQPQPVQPQPQQQVISQQQFFDQPQTNTQPGHFLNAQPVPVETPRRPQTNVAPAPVRNLDTVGSTIGQNLKPKSKSTYDAELIRHQAENARYSFSAAVSDGISDNEHIREETRDGLKLKGVYSYSDGYFKRTVHYQADENGYRVVKEDVEPIGDGPQVNPYNGRAEVSSNIEGNVLQYSVTPDDFYNRHLHQQQQTQSGKRTQQQQQHATQQIEQQF